MSISFNEIPFDIRTPGFYAEVLKPQTNGTPIPRNMVHFSQKLAAGSQPSGQPLLVTNADAAKDAFGVGSIAAHMAEAHFVSNKNVPLTVVAIDDNVAAVVATGTLTVTGPATAAGIVTVYIGGMKVEAAVADADAPTVIATAIADAVNANPNLPVTAAAASGVVTLTAKNKGEVGNDIDVRLNYNDEKLPTGVAVVIVAMNGGAGNPDVNAAIAGIPGSLYINATTPWRDAANITSIETEVTRRWNAMVNLDMFAFIGVPGTFNEMLSYMTGKNSPLTVFIQCGKSPTLPWVKAASIAAQNCGEGDPARPRQTLVALGVLPAAQENRLEFEEREILLKNGMATTYVDAGNKVRISRLVTAYRTNDQGLPDISMSDLVTMETSSYIRFRVKGRYAERYPRHKLANDDTRIKPGQPVVTPSMARAEMISLFTELEENDGVVENFKQFKKDLIVVRSTSDVNRLDTKFPPDLMNQLRVGATQIAPRL